MCFRVSGASQPPAAMGATGATGANAPAANQPQQGAGAARRLPPGAVPLPGMGPARAAAAQGQPAPDTGVFGRVKTGLAAFKAAITAAFTRPAAAPQPAPQPAQQQNQIPATVTVRIGNGTVAIDKAQYEPMIMALPKGERAGAIANLTATLQRRVDIGLAVLNDVRTGHPQCQATPQNVADMMLALYATAAKQGDPFTNGSFSVNDDNGAIANWLDTSSEVYVRSSSHLLHHQMGHIDGHRNIQRGIDIPEGVRTGLPNGHRTVLYGSIPGFAGHTPPIARRIFIKTESAGCRINTASSDLQQKAVNTGVGMKIRDKRLSDVGEFFRHAFSFVATRGQQGSTAARKEHFPSNVAKAYKEVISDLQKQAKTGGPSSPAAWALMQFEDAGTSKGSGVCELRRAVATIKGAQPSLTAAMDKLSNAIARMPHPDHLDYRLGNEVIIDLP